MKTATVWVSNADIRMIQEMPSSKTLGRNIAIYNEECNHSPNKIQIGIMGGTLDRKGEFQDQIDTLEIDGQALDEAVDSTRELLDAALKVIEDGKPEDMIRFLGSKDILIYKNVRQEEETA
ncbi:MAG: hypothetical protein ACXQTL_05500 [Methanosarcinales archaeon]